MIVAESGQASFCLTLRLGLCCRFNNVEPSDLWHKAAVVVICSQIRSSKARRQLKEKLPIAVTSCTKRLSSAKEVSVANAERDVVLS